MGMKELRQLNDQSGQAWRNFLTRAYQTVQKDHSASSWSWVKTRLRRGNRVETAVNASAQVSGAAGVALGAAGVAGVAALSVGTGGALVVALPALIAFGALGYWGYNKNEHHKVNEEIWKFFDKYRDPNDTLKLLSTASDKNNSKFDDVKKWLGWFGDEGISNMNHLEAKLKEAKARFENNFKALESQRNALLNKMKLWSAAPQVGPQAASKEQQKQSLIREADDLANKYMTLAQDLEYVWYRLERTFMYYQMVELTVKRLQEEMKPELTRIETDAKKFFQDNMTAYETLWDGFNDLPLPAK